MLFMESILLLGWRKGISTLEDNLQKALSYVDEKVHREVQLRSYVILTILTPHQFKIFEQDQGWINSAFQNGITIMYLF